MTPNLDPIRPTQSVLSWLVENRDGVLIGAATAAAIVALMLVARLIGDRMVARETEAHHLGWRSVVGRVLAKTSIFFMVMAAIDIVASYAQPPERGQHLVDIGFTIAFALQGAIWARELILALIARRVGIATTESTLGNATAIIRVLVSVALFALAIIAILDNLGINVTALVAGLGIGGIAIGLAAQGIFSDLFSALAILFDKPFKRGDTIRYDNTTGTVERIGLKTTRLRSLTGEQRIMSNTKLLEREIQNLAVAKARRITVYLAVAGKPAGETVDAIVSAASEGVESQNSCKLARCVFTGVGAGALTFDLVYDDSSLNNDKIARNRANILRALIDRLESRELELVRASDLLPAPAEF